MITVFTVLWLTVSVLIGKLIRGNFYNKKNSLKGGFMLIGISFVLGITMLIIILFSL